MHDFCGGIKLAYAHLSSFMSLMNNEVVYLYIAWSSSIFVDMYKMEIYCVTL
jgi:hypothetical protein